MSATIGWLLVFVGLYWVYSLGWGIRCARSAGTAADFFLAGRRLTPWMFILAATAASFSGWIFLTHPGLVYRDGFPYLFTSFAAIAIPLTGVLFMKRQWMIGRRFGYVTPGEMLADYFGGDAVRVLTVVVALLSAIPFLGVQMLLSGRLVSLLSDGAVPADTAMWVLSLVVLAYVATGGFRAVASVATLQCVLFSVGIMILGAVALDAVGGWGALNDGLAALGAGAAGMWRTTEGHGGGDYNAYFAVPGAIQFTLGFGKEVPAGGAWTGVMCLSYVVALMGVQAAPAFTMWAFGAADARPFAPQQVWASSLGIGLMLFVFSAFQGLGAHFLGADPKVTEAGLAAAQAIPVGAADDPDLLVPAYIGLIADRAPWLVGLLAVGGLAAMQAAGAALMSTTGAMLARDLYRRFLDPAASDYTQKRWGRFGIVFVTVAALALATVSGGAMERLGGFAIAVALQMWPALAAVCWLPWLTPKGVTWGIIAGIAGVILTDDPGVALLESVGLDLWGRWPWTIHAAGWGIMLNVGVCVVVSALTQDASARACRMRVHGFLAEHDTRPPEVLSLRPIAWIAALSWLFFAVGPGAVVGNDIFGGPAAGRSGWTFGVPSIWAWQLLFWLLGVALMWFLAYRLRMSTPPETKVEALTEDIKEARQQPDR